MTRAMARELGDYNICVNTVAPGFVETEGRQVEPAFSASRVANRSLKRVQVEGHRIDVREDRFGARATNGSYRGEKSEGGQDDLIAWADVRHGFPPAWP